MQRMEMGKRWDARGKGTREDAVEEHGAVIALEVVLVLAQPKPIAEQELLKVVQLFEEQESQQGQKLQ